VDLFARRPLRASGRLRNVVVAAEFLRRGGRRVDARVDQRARNEGASAMLLEVREANGPARGLYRSTVFASRVAAVCTTTLRRRTRFCIPCFLTAEAGSTAKAEESQVSAPFPVQPRSLGDSLPIMKSRLGNRLNHAEPCAIFRRVYRAVTNQQEVWQGC